MNEWHPPFLDPYYRILGAEFVERLAANILRFAFEEPAIDVWENEGGYPAA